MAQQPSFSNLGGVLPNWLLPALGKGIAGAAKGAFNAVNTIPANQQSPTSMLPNLGSFSPTSLLSTVRNPNISAPVQNTAIDNKTQIAKTITSPKTAVKNGAGTQIQGQPGDLTAQQLAGSGNLTADQMTAGLGDQQGTSTALTGGLSNDQILAIINSEMSKQGQDPFNLPGQSTQNLNSILQSIQDSIGKINNQPSYLDIINQSRQQQNIPQLQQQYGDIGNLINTLNQNYSQGNIDLTQQSTLQPFLQGQQSLLQQQYQGKLANLIGQQNVVGQQLGIGQQNVAQNLQAAQAQQQLGLGTAGLGLQLGQLAPQYATLPAQQQLLQAQAQQAQAQAQFYQNLYGGLTNGGQTGTQQGGQGGQVLPQFQGAVNGQALSKLPSILQGAVTTDIAGNGYIVESRVPSLGGMGADLAKSYAGQLGVPILSDEQASAITALDTTQNNLTDLQGKIGGLLGSGLGGTIQGLTLNNIEKMLGVGQGPALTQIDSFREAAIKQIQGLASGSTGLRINQAEIQSATKNLPTSSDNIETANAKLQQLAVFFKNQRQALFALGGMKSSVASMNANQNSVGWGF